MQSFLHIFDIFIDLNCNFVDLVSTKINVVAVVQVFEIMQLRQEILYACLKITAKICVL
jgi:hypothetical protein